MALDLNIFYSCTIDERMAIVSECGEYITRIKNVGYYIHLYLVDGDLVEVYYNINSNLREDVEVLDLNDERINLYTVTVDLSDLYRNILFSLHQIKILFHRLNFIIIKDKLLSYHTCTYY